MTQKSQIEGPSLTRLIACRDCAKKKESEFIRKRSRFRSIDGTLKLPRFCSICNKTLPENSYVTALTLLTITNNKLWEYRHFKDSKQVD